MKRIEWTVAERPSDAMTYTLRRTRPAAERQLELTTRISTKKKWKLYKVTTCVEEAK